MSSPTFKLIASFKIIFVIYFLYYNLYIYNRHLFIYYIYISMYVYKYNLLSCLVFFVCLFAFQNYLLCIGQLEGLFLGDSNSPPSSYLLPIVSVMGWSVNFLLSSLPCLWILPSFWSWSGLCSDFWERLSRQTSWFYGFLGISVPSFVIFPGP